MSNQSDLNLGTCRIRGHSWRTRSLRTSLLDGWLLGEGRTGERTLPSAAIQMKTIQEHEFPQLRTSRRTLRPVCFKELQ